MKKVIRGLWVISVLVLIGCGDLHDPTNDHVTNGEIVVDLDGDVIKQSLIDAHVPGITEESVVYGQKAYKIPYTTTDEEGNAVEVSGYMVVPKGLPEALIATKGYSVVSDDHGTIFANNDAPTVLPQLTNMPAGASIILTSLAGFVTLQPDYIGFGDSKDHYHPFILKKSLANATVDFIRAAKAFALENNINLNDQLFLTGYSEGGYAALATLEKIEKEGLLKEIPVTMAAPMAGPYDVNLTAFGVLSQPTLSVPSFMADVGYAYAKAYDRPLDSVINEPYASKLPSLFDGTKERTLIDPELTTQTTGENGLFNPMLVQDFFMNTNNWFRIAVAQNNVHEWAPQTTVRLLHCKSDDVIPYTIAQVAEATMNHYGAKDVVLLGIEEQLGIAGAEIGHASCGEMGYSLASHIFADVRAKMIGY
jgi:predicted esterase